MNHIKKRASFIHLRWACRVIIGLTAIVSIWANVLHARSGLVAIVFAALPPLVVLGGWELVSRIPIRTEAGRLVRWSRPLATAAIAFGAAWLSYWHQQAAVMRYTGDEQASYILPLLIDGLMVIASVSVYELNTRILDLDAYILAGGVIKKPKEDTPVPVKKDKAPSGKERIASILARAPEFSIKEIADAAGTSYNYAHSVVRELRQAPEPATA